MAWKISYTLKFQPTPLSRWVHKAVDRRAGDSARAFKVETNKVVVEFEPPVPVVMNRGYPTIQLELGTGEVLRFSSLHEMRHVADALRKDGARTSPWLEDMPVKAFAPERAAATLALITNAIREIEDSGEVGE